MDSKGGRFTLTINGRRYSGRAKATIKAAGIAVTGGTNMDGTGYKTVAPKNPSLDLTFDRGVGLRWDEAMLLEDLNVTFVETDAKVTHLFTNASWIGEPSTDTENGEVSGLSIECAPVDYQAR